MLDSPQVAVDPCRPCAQTPHEAEVTRGPVAPYDRGVPINAGAFLRLAVLASKPEDIDVRAGRPCLQAHTEGKIRNEIRRYVEMLRSKIQARGVPYQQREPRVVPDCTLGTIERAPIFEVDGLGKLDDRHVTASPKNPFAMPLVGRVEVSEVPAARDQYDRVVAHVWEARRGKSAVELRHDAMPRAFKRRSCADMDEGVTPVVVNRHVADNTRCTVREVLAQGVFDQRP
jgi:hypothetical protein